MLQDERSSKKVDPEQALSRTQERYRLLVQCTKEYAMFTTDEAAIIDSWNKGAERILGYTEEEAVGLSAAIIFTAEDQAAGAYDQELRTAREEGQAMNERWHVRKDGSRFWGSGAVTSLWDNGTLRGYAKVMRDNTLRKQAQEALEQSEQRCRQLAEALEERVEERTAQVRALATELVTAEQAERQRIARTLHDHLQQTLYAAEMQLHFLRQKVGEPEELAELAATLNESMRLTRQLTVELSPPVLRAQGLRKSLEWLGTHMHETYQLRVKVESGPEQWVAPSEQGNLLFEIVRELLFNVVKHAGTKKAEVTINKGEHSIQVTVSDDGQGFDVEAVMNKRGGFGLHSVRERLELFGGHMELDSRPGAGTRVTLYLPALDDETGDSAGQALET